MTSMDWIMKRCCTSNSLLKPCCSDRFTNLPDDILGRILSMLPTKTVAAMQVLSKKMGHALSLITSVDLDDSPVSLCLERPHLVEYFPLFKSFIDNALMKLSHSKQALARFRLRFGGDKTTFSHVFTNSLHYCEKDCFPDLEPARLNVWISYPLAHHGLRELDLSFHVRNPCDCKLPPGLFASQSLEVLKLDSNLAIDDCAHIPLIRLPNLKLLCLHSFVFTEDDFVTRLVSSCPSLEDLSVTCCSWVKSDRLIISSPSLRRFVFDNLKCDEEKNSELVLLDIPNVRFLNYVDNLPHRFSVAHFNDLVEAHITIVGVLRYDTFETSFRSQLSLLRALSDVQHLSLLGTSAENVNFAGELKDQLPVFRYLRTLELDPFFGSRWDIVLLSILHCSPVLETLIFPEGLFECIYRIYVDPRPSDTEDASMEAEGWRTTQTIPSCCLTHLKRIELNSCFGIDRELNMIKFLLSKTSVLKEFVIRLSYDFKGPTGVQFDAPNLDEFVSTLEELPRASKSCSITVQR